MPVLRGLRSSTRIRSTAGSRGGARRRKCFYPHRQGTLFEVKRSSSRDHLQNGSFCTTLQAYGLEHVHRLLVGCAKLRAVSVAEFSLECMIEGDIGVPDPLFVRVLCSTENTEVPEWDDTTHSTTMAILILANYNTARLLRPLEAESYIHIWSAYVHERDYPKDQLHMHPIIDAHLLWLLCRGHRIGSCRTFDQLLSACPGIVSLKAALLLLSNPFHTWPSFTSALQIVEGHLLASTD